MTDITAWLDRVEELVQLVVDQYDPALHMPEEWLEQLLLQGDRERYSGDDLLLLLRLAEMARNMSQPQAQVLGAQGLDTREH